MINKTDVKYYDFVIIGAGVIGLTLAKELLTQFENKKVLILEKENNIAMHSSGRNSGVLHAGFYYTSDSLKAKFTKEGNHLLTNYCDENNLQINKCGKLVVAKNAEELETLHTLYERGIKNGVDIKLITEQEALKIDPNIKTFKKALYSPTTSTVDPAEVCNQILKNVKKLGGEIYVNEGYLKKGENNSIITTSGKTFYTKKIINTAGLYADKIARDYGFSKNYIIIPFKGIYLKYTNNDKPVKTNIYPVPNLKNPFLGVHFTITVDGHIKIGPTSIPAFWRENYKGFSRFKVSEAVTILLWEAKLFIKNSFGFRNLAVTEIKKYNRRYFVNLANELVKSIEVNGFNKWTKPGIRAQLLNVKTGELVQDFVVEGDENSIHVLNAVSPAFTSSIPFCKWIIENYIKDK